MLLQPWLRSPAQVASRRASLGSRTSTAGYPLREPSPSLKRRFTSASPLSVRGAQSGGTGIGPSRSRTVTAQTSARRIGTVMCESLSGLGHTAHHSAANAAAHVSGHSHNVGFGLANRPQQLRRHVDAAPHLRGCPDLAGLFVERGAAHPVG